MRVMPHAKPVTTLLPVKPVLKALFPLPQSLAYVYALQGIISFQ